MKITPILFLIFCFSAFAKDVQVKGYTKSNGTYVAPYTRSSPDSTRSNNYGRPSSSDYGGNYKTRDQDKDVIYNQYDNDDDNDGISDNDE